MAAATPVFISHSSHDRVTAERLCASLESSGIPCWISSRDITPGENFQEAIVRAVTGARVMVLVFSANANGSDEIKKELALASQNRLAVVPVRVEDVLPTDAFKYELATRQWIDVFKDGDRAIQRLTSHVAELLGEARAAAPAAPISRKNGWRRWVAAVVAVLILAVGGGAWFVSGPAKPPPADPAGAWVTGEIPNVYDASTTFTLRFEIERNGTEYGGRIKEAAIGRAGVWREIEDGHLAGDVITFHTQGKLIDGGTYKQSYRGVIHGNEIAFTRMNDVGSGGEPEKFTAKRE
jgi:hypothetical protein